MTTITTQLFTSCYPVVRNGATLDCLLEWDAECHYRQWKEKHDEGPSEPQSELEHVELVLCSASIEMRDDELRQAKKSALREAWDEIE